MGMTARRCGVNCCKKEKWIWNLNIRMKFKNWLNEIAQGNQAQTNQATDTAANHILKDKSFANLQSDLLRQQPSPSAQQRTLVDFTTRGLTSAVPNHIAKQTNAPAVAHNVQNKMGLSKIMPPPKFMRQK